MISMDTVHLGANDLLPIPCGIPSCYTCRHATELYGPDAVANVACNRVKNVETGTQPIRVGRESHCELYRPSDEFKPWIADVVKELIDQWELGGEFGEEVL